jgi:hypothetical protein
VILLIVSLESVLVKYHLFADTALNVLPAWVDKISVMVSDPVFGEILMRI